MTSWLFHGFSGCGKTTRAYQELQSFTRLTIVTESDYMRDEWKSFIEEEKSKRKVKFLNVGQVNNFIKNAECKQVDLCLILESDLINCDYQEIKKELKKYLTKKKNNICIITSTWSAVPYDVKRCIQYKWTIDCKESEEYIFKRS